jgi:hypothetical protein
MLFISEIAAPQVFWMKNTLIPLDMIFIGADWRIAGIVENAEPQTLTAREVAAPSQYVLEIGGGLSARYGIRAGQLVDFQAARREVARPWRRCSRCWRLQADAPLSDPNLVYELKYDGIRALDHGDAAPGSRAARRRDRVAAGNDKTAQFPRWCTRCRAGARARRRRAARTARSSRSTPTASRRASSASRIAFT